MTKIMGILNVTPDSFYEGGRHSTTEAAVAHGIKLAEEGADLLDIGGESSRPGSDPVGEQEELERVIPVIKALHEKLSIPLSIDTMKSEVARQAVEAGASMINDVSGFHDSKMREVAASTGVDICVMHMQGLPKTMQQNPKYEGGVVPNIIKWFETRITDLLNAGVKRENIMLDPGIGFGKTVAHNYAILDNLVQFQSLGFPLLLGISRKSFLSKVANQPSDSNEILAATMAVNGLAINAGVDVIRVHDVKEHRVVINVLESQ